MNSPVPNITVHHTATKTRKEISVGNKPWGVAVKLSIGWMVFCGGNPKAVAASSSFRGIESAVYHFIKGA